MGDTYNNHQVAACFLEYISDIEKQKLVTDIDDVKFFSLTMDGSTDKLVTEQDTIFIRWCSMGKIQTRYLCIGEPNSTTSEDLYIFVREKVYFLTCRIRNLLDLDVIEHPTCLGRKMY